MSIRTNAKYWSVKEQIVEDPVSGLTFQFEVLPSGTKILRIFGERLPYGNRDIFFDQDGIEDGSGTSTSGLCKPSWPTEIEE